MKRSQLLSFHAGRLDMATLRRRGEYRFAFAFSAAPFENRSNAWSHRDSSARSFGLSVLHVSRPIANVRLLRDFRKDLFDFAPFHRELERSSKYFEFTVNGTNLESFRLTLRHEASSPFCRQPVEPFVRQRTEVEDDFDSVLVIRLCFYLFGERRFDESSKVAVDEFPQRRCYLLLAMTIERSAGG